MVMWGLASLVGSAVTVSGADAFSGGVQPPGGASAASRPAVSEALEAQIRIADAPWLDRELTRFCAALGRDSRSLRKSLAEALYHTRTLDAIDISRPAVFMWSKGNAPLQAIIPIRADMRRQFVEEFGVMGAGEAPLVRVGDRDGTVIYTQNHVDGLREYRLLVTDSVAFLARSAEECRKLAARAATLLPVVGSDVAPVTLTCSGAWLREHDLLSWSWSPRVPLYSWLPNPELLSAAQQAILGQVESMSFEVRPSAGGKARLTTRFVAVAESELAAWIATQQNQGSRLQTQIGGPETALKITSRIVWQDKLGQIAARLLPSQRTARGAAWTPLAESAWNQTFAVAERVVDAVWSVEVPSPGRQVQMLVLDQPRGDEQVQALNQMAGTYLTVPATLRAITGYQAAVRTVPAADGHPALTSLVCATNQHTVMVDGWNIAENAVLTHTEAAVRRLQQVSSAVGEPAILNLWCNLGRVVRLAPAIDTEVTIADAVVTGTLRTVGVNALQVEVNIPLQDSALALGHLPDDGRERHSGSK
jgi:hypothetical protein